MTPSWEPISVTTPPCPCRWATRRAPTRAARSLAWADRYMTPSIAHKAQWPMGLPQAPATARTQGRSLNIPLTTRRKPATEPPSTLSSHIISPSGFLGFSVFSSLFFFLAGSVLPINRGSVSGSVGSGSRAFFPFALGLRRAEPPGCGGGRSRPYPDTCRACRARVPAGTFRLCWGEETNWFPKVSGCLASSPFCQLSSLWFLCKFQEVFTKEKYILLFIPEEWGRNSGGGAGKSVTWERGPGHDAKYLQLPSDWISPGPTDLRSSDLPQGQVGKVKAVRGSEILSCWAKPDPLSMLPAPQPTLASVGFVLVVAVT